MAPPGFLTLGSSSMESLRPTTTSSSSLFHFHAVPRSPTSPKRAVSTRCSLRRGVVSSPETKLRCERDEEELQWPTISRSIGKTFFGLAAVASTVFALCGDSPSLAESLTVAFPVSRVSEVNRVQRTLVEAWGLIRETFVDPTFNHQDWDLKLQQTMVEMFSLNSADAAYNKISAMLSTLDDPFTRIISPKEYQSFRIGSDGNLQGVGLFISVEPSTGRLVVLSKIEGSPASRSDILDGDELVEINV